MIPQEHPKFKKHVSYLVDMIQRTKGMTPYFTRTEEFENPEDIAASEWVTCGKCSKRVSVSDECKWLDTGSVKFLENVKYTKCCGRTLEPEMCTFVCVCCERPAVYITPHSNETGFEYKPGQIYHIDACSECDGTGGMKSMIIEQTVHNKLNNTKSQDSTTSQ